MRRGRGGVQGIDLLVRVGDRLAVDDFRHGFLDGVDAVAREGHEHSPRRRHGHTDHLLLELRHHLQVTDVTINGDIAGDFLRANDIIVLVLRERSYGKQQNEQHCTYFLHWILILSVVLMFETQPGPIGPIAAARV